MININESIQGIVTPKIVHNYGQSDAMPVVLGHFIVTRDEPESIKEIIQESQLIADRTIIPQGDFWLFEGLINLFSYDSLALARSKFEEIYQFNKQDVCLAKHLDQEILKDADGSPVLFHLNVALRSLASTDSRDILFVQLRSLTEVYYSDGSEILAQPEEITMSTIYKTTI